MKRFWLPGLSMVALALWTGCGWKPVETQTAGSQPLSPVAKVDDAQNDAAAVAESKPAPATQPDAKAASDDAESNDDALAETLTGTDVPLIGKNGEKCDTECKDGCMPGDTATIAAKSSHKQSRTLQPMHEGKPLALHTFCVTATGNILACVGGGTDDYGASQADKAEGYRGVSKPTTMVQVYGPDLKLKHEIAVKFKPTAINPAVDGKSFYVAGEGRVAHIAMSGEVLAETNAPNIGDPEKFKTAALSAYKREMAQQAKTYTDNIKVWKKQLGKIEETPEAERTARQKAQFEALKAQIETYESVVTQFEGQADDSRADQIVKSKMDITALAVTEKDVFVCCRALRGYGYEVWRTTTDLNEDESLMVIDNISGCCGQLDIQAQGDRLLIAENGKFQVTTYDRDGEEVSHFGKRDRSVIEGWGSCCNPMNIRCLPNGGVLVAESSIGNLKTYDADGKFVSYVGKAKVSGGCKHVACGFDTERNRYYFMNVDKGHICVLVPSSEAPAMTEDEKLANEAREGLGKKFGGVWIAAKSDAKAPEGKIAPGTTQGIANKLEVLESGELKIKGGMLGQYSGPNGSFEWNPAKQNGNQLHVRLVMEGVDQWGLNVDFVDDNTIKVVLPELGEGMVTTFYREGTRPAEESAAEAAEPAETVLGTIPFIIDAVENEATDETDEKPSETSEELELDEV
jgi:hypothetical protein